jgi:hypothetical protein
LDNGTSVFHDPSGVGWNCSVSYNPALRKYILCTEHTRSLRGNLGIFAAPEPWGPWETIYYQGDGQWEDAGTTFYWNFSNKWADGLDFVMVYTGVNDQDAWQSVAGHFGTSQAEPWAMDVGRPRASVLTILDLMAPPSSWGVTEWCAGGHGQEYPHVGSDGLLEISRRGGPQMARVWWNWDTKWARLRVYDDDTPRDIPFWTEPIEYPNGDGTFVYGQYVGAYAAGDSCRWQVVDAKYDVTPTSPWCRYNMLAFGTGRVYNSGWFYMTMWEHWKPVVLRTASLEGIEIGWCVVDVVEE